MVKLFELLKMSIYRNSMNWLSDVSVIDQKNYDSHVQALIKGATPLEPKKFINCKESLKDNFGINATGPPRYWLVLDSYIL